MPTQISKYLLCSICYFIFFFFKISFKLVYKALNFLVTFSYIPCSHWSYYIPILLTTCWSLFPPHDNPVRNKDPPPCNNEHWRQFTSQPCKAWCHWLSHQRGGIQFYMSSATYICLFLNKDPVHFTS